MKLVSRCLLAVTLLAFAGCSIWPVDQDPKGMNYRRDANRVLDAIQAWQHDHGGAFPRSLSELAPKYIPSLPGEPKLDYHPYDGSVIYHYIPSWPQLRPVWCQSVGSTTEWQCREHVV